MKTRSWRASAVLAAAGLATSAQVSPAQPITKNAEGQTVVQIPASVVVFPSGAIEVKTKDVLVPPGGRIEDFVVREVPIFEVNEEGTLSAGTCTRNATDHPINFAQWRCLR